MSARIGRPPRPALERFNGHHIPEPNTGCWIWTSGVDRDGYGQFFECRGGEQRAHRFAYKQFVGEIPAGRVLDHLCRVRCCVNPAHLEAVTNRENVVRGVWPWASRTHCKYGHEFTAENTRQTGKLYGKRCRKCHADYQRRWRAERKAA